MTNKIIDFVKDWLDSNITDELQPEVLKADSRDLLDKINEMEKATSHKRQASSALKRTQLNNRIKK